MHKQTVKYLTTCHAMKVLEVILTLCVSEGFVFPECQMETSKDAFRSLDSSAV